MNLRLLATTALTVFSVFTTTAHAGMERYTNGTEYWDVKPAQATHAEKGKIEVIEFFSYQCPHCKTLDPYIETWRKALPEDVEFKRVPAIFNKTWDVPAKAYYAMEALGITDKVHEGLFKAIHVENKNLSSNKAMAKELAKLSGLSEEKVTAALTSFNTANQSGNGVKMARAYSLRFVPAFAVNGKYMTSVSRAGGPKEILEVLNFLIAKERAAQ